MSREEVHFRQHRDRLLALAESTTPHKPNNTKRRPNSSKSPLRLGSKSMSGPKLSIQDFVRADPGYTPNIEHLVFPDRKKSSPVKSSSMDSGKTRSRLAEMFALSRHLQQRSADRETKHSNNRKQPVNRSMDSGTETCPAVSTSSAVSANVAVSGGGVGPPRRWTPAEEPVQHTATKPANVASRLSPNADTDCNIMTTRGSNVSVLHLRSTSEPWETSPTSGFNVSRSYGTVRALPKYQSLGAGNGYSRKKDDSFISSSQVSSGELFGCSRELSPVRWCDREVDGVYLGRSGWVQVQQRSLDENRRQSYGANLAPTTSSLPASRRPHLKLADYHCNSEPGQCPDGPVRPAYLPLRPRDHDFGSASPSPCAIPESFSPPPITPIISPPPAFQDRVSRTSNKTRTLYNKPFLPRSNAIVDSDVISPPASPPSSPPPPPPPINWSTLPEPGSGITARRSTHHAPYTRIPQAKSLEEGSCTSRRSQFLQRYKDSSSSSSSSLGFRSLDSCVSRPAMPRLLEHADSLDVYEDADEEDNNSSSLNLSNVSSVLLNSSPDSVLERVAARDKASPSGRSRHRPQRRSPASSDANKQLTCSSPSSSSSSGGGGGGGVGVGVGFPVRSPSGGPVPFRRSAPSRQYTAPRIQPDEHKVRRSRSLQLPEKRSPGTGTTSYRDHQTKLSPQQTIIVKPERNRRSHINQPHSITDILDEDMAREAEVVTEFLYASRSRAAAKALLMQRYHREESNEPPKPPLNNGVSVYFVGSNKARGKPLQRGATTPNITKVVSPTTDVKNPCTSNTCDFWPHCAHRDTLTGQPPVLYTTSSMKVSQSYPAHARGPNGGHDTHKKRAPPNVGPGAARISPDSRCSHPTRRSEKRDADTYKRKSSPSNTTPSPLNISVQVPAQNSSCSSSSSDVWVTTSDRTATKSPRNAKSSGASTPMEEGRGEQLREMILTRPGSAPADVDQKAARGLADSQQRSMSLPKSFLSGTNGAKHSGQFPCKHQGSENRGLSPSPRHRPPTPEIAHTAPVTPSHEPAVDRRRSPGLTKAARRNKASSTPHLLDEPDWDLNRKWTEKTTSSSIQENINPKESVSATMLTHPRLQPQESTHTHKNVSGNATESVLQKFRKTFSLRFQKKGSKESCSSDYGDGFIDPSEEDSPQHIPTTETVPVTKDTDTEQKYRFGPLVWRSSKERKKNNKASRSLKCNSGDSGIQIEMATGFSGSGVGGGDSSESHDTDHPGDETDSPQPVRRRRGNTNTTNNESGAVTKNEKAARPHSDHLINQILIDKFKAELQSRSQRHQHVRRTHSDLGGQRLLQWDTRSPYHRLMIMTSTSTSTSPLKVRPQRVSPKRNPPDAPGAVQLRPPRGMLRPALRRSLSQPVDIDKLSPLMRTRTAGLRLIGGNVVSEDEHDGRGGTSDDEMMSDSESSIASINERKKSLELAVDEEMVILAEAVFDHVAIEAEELAFRAGDVIEVLETVNRDWWWGTTDGRTGWFPAAFVRLRVSQEDTVEDCLAAMASGKCASKQLRRRTSISLLSNEQVRTSVVRELVHTERDFVKVLTDVVEGYIAECRRRKDMFSIEQIQTIFINLEDMLKFQSAFLKDLESCIDWDAPHKSCVGNCFLTHRAGFRMYSDYCNQHPMATATLQELYQFNNYSKFFEACRLMRGLIEIPLDGYLLTPVQRICKYPLQLAELLKYTKSDHPDYDKIKEALEAMRDVAVLINERKRRMESLEKIAGWQQRVEGWEGGDLIEVSSQLIHQGEVIRVTSGMWTNNITLFLFDHQIVYCKKDILKRNTYVYKGRIFLDTSEIIDVPDGKDPQLGVSVRHGLKVYSCVRDKWLFFCCRSSGDKQRWLEAFAQERRLVAQDRDEGLEFPAAARKLAKLGARCQRRPPSKPRAGKTYKRDAAYMGSTLQINSHSSNSLGRKMGTWFTFGSNKKTRHHEHAS